MIRFFPLSQLPPRKFELGQRVEVSFPDEVTKQTYLIEGTIFGYHYQHPMWVSEVLPNFNPGWVYTVLQTYEDGEEGTAPFITQFHEDELVLIEDNEDLVDYPLNQQIKTRLFGSIEPISSLLQRCSMNIRGAFSSVEIVIDCGEDEALASQIWRVQSMLRAITNAWNLPKSIRLIQNGRSIHLLQHSFEVPSPTNTITMSENPIIQRANRHQPLIRAIGASAVAVSLHDANNGFQFLSLYANDRRRLNKPPELVIGQPADIIDPRISEPRIHHIKRALSNGQQEVFTYTYEDEFTWRFQCAVAPIYGTEEVIVITSDLENWQRHYWLNKLN